MNEDLEVRPVEPGEVPVVCEVQRRAFGGREAEAQLVEALHASGVAAISLLAMLDGRVVGHVLFSEVGLDPEFAGRPAIVGLAPVGVLPEEQGGGVGSALIRTGLEECRRSGYRVVVVLGEPAYYHRFGFSRARDYGLGNEYGVDEAFMALELEEGALSGAGGTVQYRPEFRETV